MIDARVAALPFSESLSKTQKGPESQKARKARKDLFSPQESPKLAVAFSNNIGQQETGVCVIGVLAANLVVLQRLVQTISLPWQAKHQAFLPKTGMFYPATPPDTATQQHQSGRSGGRAAGGAAGRSKRAHKSPHPTIQTIPSDSYWFRISSYRLACRQHSPEKQSHPTIPVLHVLQSLHYYYYTHTRH